jgi:hypothetical protein
MIFSDNMIYYNMTIGENNFLQGMLLFIGDAIIVKI